MSHDDDRAQLFSLLDDFSNAMFVTTDPNGAPRARPMHVLDRDDAGGVWFVTRRGSGKVEEIRDDHHAALTLQGTKGFISMSGVATLSPDRAKLRDKWSKDLDAWFPDGPEDPEALLIRFRAHEAEYWKGGVEGYLKVAFAAAKAMVKGEPVKPPKDLHGNVNL